MQEVVLDTLRKRLQAYHSALNQAIFGFALLGGLVVIHLAIQQGRGFDRGCLGFSGLEAGQMAFDCSTVVSSQAGTLFGVSNIIWGLGFYIFIAALTFAIFWVTSIWRAWIQGVRLSSLVLGLLYSGYLVYVQMGVIGALCIPCLASAAVTALLFGLQGAVFWIDDQPTDTTMPPRVFKRDLTVYVYLLALTAVLVGTDLTYFNALAPVEEERARAHAEQFSGAACQLDRSSDAIEDNGNSLIDFQDVTQGPSDASVTIIEYFDPNCPHCKDFHETMNQLVSEYQQDVRFVFKPFPLRGSSLPEIQALYIAHQEGKFFEMLDAQYERQDQSGITEADLREIAAEIGMNPDVLISRIDAEKHREKVLAQRKRAVSIGVDSTPTVLVNGHFVESRSLECMKVFIERAREGKLGQSGPSS